MVENIPNVLPDFTVAELSEDAILESMNIAGKWATQYWQTPLRKATWRGMKPAKIVSYDSSKLPADDERRELPIYAEPAANTVYADPKYLLNYFEKNPRLAPFFRVITTIIIFHECAHCAIEALGYHLLKSPPFSNEEVE